MSTTHPTKLLLATSALALTVALSACGAKSDSTAGATVAATASSTAAAAAPDQSARGGDGGGAFPGASGLVAAVSGTTAQVRGQSGQTAVSWTDATTFTTTVTGAISDIAVGDCVVVSGGSDGEAATSVSITEAVDGECSAGGFGGQGGGPGGGAMPSGMPTDMPSGMPTDVPGGQDGAMPSDMPSGMPTDMPSGMAGGGMGQRVSGPVTAVSGTSVTVAAVSFQQDASATTTPTTVTVGTDTTVTKAVAGTADAVIEGVCVRATGETDSVGAVAATSIAVTEAVDGECNSGRQMGGQ